MKPSDLEPQNLRKTLFSMTWPMLFGVLSLMSFQLVDSAFIGQLGVEPLAAVGFTVPMFQLIIGIQVGLGIATTAVISRTLGEGNDHLARQQGSLVLLVGAVLMLCICSLIWLLRAPTLDLLGAEPTLLPVVESLWAPWLVSAWVSAMLYFGYSICRSHGNTMLPGLMMVATSLLNIALDPLYIFYFELGLPGAAWATLTSFCLGCCVIFPSVIKRAWLSADIKSLPLLKQINGLGSIMGPAMLSQMMPALSAMLATAIVAGFGTAAVAAWGLGTRLEFFSIVVVLALTMSVPPMIGRLLGARNFDTIEQLIKLAVSFVLVFQFVVAFVWFLVSVPLSNVLSSEAAVSLIVQEYLVRVPLSYSFLGVCILMVSACNAMGLSMRALAISCIRLFICYLPALWIGAQVADFNGLLTGVMIGNIAAGVLAWHLYRQGMNYIRSTI